jgi:hypothetical protein
MKRTLAALVAGIALGSTGIAVAAHLMPVGYGVGCYKDAKSKAVICLANGKHSNLAVGISNQFVSVIDLKGGKALYAAKQR